jgi:hypothetical protein
MIFFFFKNKVTTTKASTTTTKKTNNNYEIWNEFDVKSWLLRKNIDSRIQEVLKKTNGMQLKQFKLIRKEVPLYFFKSISQDSKIEISAVAHFINEFEKL